VARRGFLLGRDFERVVFLAMEIIGCGSVDGNNALDMSMNPKVG
jgi:hypothetical protein